MSDKVFKYVKDTDKGPDFTGASADYYLQKYGIINCTRLYC